MQRAVAGYQRHDAVLAVAVAPTPAAAAPTPVAVARLPAYVACMTISLIALALLAAQPAPPEPMIPTATIDDSLEIGGEALAATEERTRLLIEVSVNGSGPWRFLVDSGADRSVIARALADRLALPPGPLVRVRGMAGTASAATAQVASLKIGSSELTDLTLPVLYGRDMGAPGLIGIDALADQRLLLDFEARTVTVQDSRRPAPVAGPDEIVVTARRRKGQLIITQASIDGVPISAVIDTGSEITVGNAVLRRRLLGNRRDLAKVTMLSVTGQTVEADVAILPEIRIGGVLMRNVTVAFADVPPFALFGLDRQPALFLGSDLLRNFRRLALDFRNRRVRFVLRR